MTTVWLTQKQLDLAIEAMQHNDTHYDVKEVFLPGFESLWFEPGAVPVFYQSITLLFRRKDATSSEFELATPVQICDEWLAKQMQTLNDR